MGREVVEFPRCVDVVYVEQHVLRLPLVALPCLILVVEALPDIAGWHSWRVPSLFEQRITHAYRQAVLKIIEAALANIAFLGHGLADDCVD